MQAYHSLQSTSCGCKTFGHRDGLRVPSASRPTPLAGVWRRVRDANDARHKLRSKQYRGGHRSWRTARWRKYDLNRESYRNREELSFFLREALVNQGCSGRQKTRSSLLILGMPVGDEDITIIPPIATHYDSLWCHV